MEWTALLEQVEVEKAEKENKRRKNTSVGQYPSKKSRPEAQSKREREEWVHAFLLKQMVCMV